MSQKKISENCKITLVWGSPTWIWLKSVTDDGIRNDGDVIGIKGASKDGVFLASIGKG